MNRRKLADRFIRWGLYLQIIFLLMVDWGTIEGIRRADTTPWVHIIGLIVVNAILLVSAVVAVYWLRTAQQRRRSARASLGTLPGPNA